VCVTVYVAFFGNGCPGNYVDFFCRRIIDYDFFYFKRKNLLRVSEGRMQKRILDIGERTEQEIGGSCIKFRFIICNLLQR
jgi:hypothetical protein